MNPEASTIVNSKQKQNTPKPRLQNLRACMLSLSLTFFFFLENQELGCFMCSLKSLMHGLVQLFFIILLAPLPGNFLDSLWWCDLLGLVTTYNYRTIVKFKAYAIETWQQKNQKIQLISNYQSTSIFFFWVRSIN